MWFSSAIFKNISVGTNTSFAENPAPSADKRSGKNKNPVPTEGTNTIWEYNVSSK
jgi:hypothetical protein